MHTRKSLYKTLFDRENAGKVLTYIITIFFAIIMVFVVMLIFELSITEYVPSSSSSSPYASHVWRLCGLSKLSIVWSRLQIPHPVGHLLPGLFLHFRRFAQERGMPHASRTYSAA